LALSALVLSGCGSAPERPSPAAAGGMVQAREKGSPSGEKIAEAYAHFGTAVIDEMNGDFADALEEYYKAMRIDPAYEALVLEVSSRLLLNKEAEKALDLVSRAAARPEASAAVFAQLGAVYSQLGKTEQAIAANRTAIKKAPTTLAGYRNLFTLFAQANRNDEALAVLDEAGRQPKAEADFLCGLAELYFTYERQAPAHKEKARARTLAILNRATQLNPVSPTVLMMLADGYSLLGDTTQAAQCYLELLKHLPDSSQVREVQELRDGIHAKLTAIYLRASDHKRAAEQLEKLLAHDPTNPSLHYCLAALALDGKEYERAAAHFSETILLNPAFEQAYYDLATAQMNLEKPAEALATLDKARAKFGHDNENFVLEFMTGMALSLQKSYAEAVGHFSSAEVIARATEPKRLNEFFYFEVGATYERKGDLAEAEKYFQKCLAIAPAFAQALNYLGYMWAEHDLNLEKARDLISQALKAEPANGAYLDSMGWVLFKLNQPQQALDYALKAAQGLEKPDATVFDHLGDIYQALKQSDKAREAWQKSLKLEPSEQVRKKLNLSGPDGTAGR